MIVSKAGKAAKAAKVVKKERRADIPKSSAPETLASKNRVELFPVVGVGASAGGLEAFEQFLRTIPDDSGMAFVLVQHLDPGHASMLTEILQRNTTIPVVEAQDQMPVAPNRVFVIPPNREMAIFNGVLQLHVPSQPRGHRMPIDSFLRSLAEERGEGAIGVILSGTGTDGTLGLRAILGAGGITYVQDPATAKYKGMPASVIQAGYATHVLPAEELAAAILSGARNGTNGRETRPETEFIRILMILRSLTGHDFTLYKRSTIGRRIERRMAQHNIEDTETYARYLNEHPAEVQALFSELLINVTSFFRDPEAFAALKKDVLPQLFAGKADTDEFRVWVAGCATGEEAYSIAMLLREYMEESGQHCKIKLYCTDIDEHAITLARASRYPHNIVQDVDPGRLHRFFVKEEDGYRLKKEIREMAVFAVQSVTRDPPFSKLDLLSCRNLLIYLKAETQDRLLATFHHALRPGGALMLSTSENTGSHPELFVPIHRKWKLYRTTHTAASVRQEALESAPPLVRTDPGKADPNAPKGRTSSLADVTDRWLLQFFAPVSLLTDFAGKILFVRGETSQFLRPAPGKPTFNIVDMAHDQLQLEMRTAMHGAVSLGRATLGREVPIKIGGDGQVLSFSVRPLRHPDSGDGLLLWSFEVVAIPAPARPGAKRADSPDLLHVEKLQQDLAHTRETLHATIEEQQTSNEELKSTNEELQSTNEELQSTNEELETSKEELQSINEELITVNSELQSKIDQLASMQDDMKNLLDNVNVGTVFLDDRLVIRRFARDAVLIYHLVPSDLGRPLSDIKSHLDSDDLMETVQTVLATTVPVDREVRTVEGAWYLVRIQPYRTLDHVIEGVVLTFMDITEMKRVREELLRAQELAEGIVDTIREPLIVLNSALQVVSASRSYYQHFGVAPEETVGRPIYELRNHHWDMAALRELLETVLPSRRSFEDYPVDQDVPAPGRARTLMSARRIVSKAGDTQLILLALEVPTGGAAAGA